MVLYHCFRIPLPYLPTWKLQEKLHQIQLAQRRNSAHQDILLLLQHRPVYTAGRRQTEPGLEGEKTRLTRLGADFVSATRGGQLTYHGPGQIIGYPLLDLARYSPTMGTRDYVCRMQRMLQMHLKEAHGIQHFPSEHTGVFLDAHTKIASIGVQVRHRLTSHGFALNVTREPLRWFNEIVACGLDDVRAGSVESAQEKTGVSIENEMDGIVEQFGKVYGRDMTKLNVLGEGEMSHVILQLEQEASKLLLPRPFIT